jgi:thiosulfate/3-mercaptopyruvate sulfurtransferase
MRRKISGAIIVLFILIGQIAWSAPHPRASLNRHLLLDTAQLGRLLADDSIDLVDLVVVDFGRAKAEYLKGHIPAAVYIPRDSVLTTLDGVPRMLPPVDQLREQIEEAGIGNNTRVVVYDHSGGLWASRLFWTLEFMGHKKVALLDGGLSRWIADGRALQVEEAKKPRATFQVQLQQDRLADRDWLLENLDNPRVKIVDTRSSAEYTGAQKRSARGGHIPGASNIDWVQNLNTGEQRIFLPVEELEALYEQGEVTRDREIVAHCQTGIRAAHTYFTLRLLGYEDVRLYDGSWAEWGNSDDTPIE